jgi:hypothetical protein
MSPEDSEMAHSLRWVTAALTDLVNRNERSLPQLKGQAHFHMRKDISAYRALIEKANSLLTKP